MLSNIAKLVAQSTGLVGYRGAGRLFKPLAMLKPFKETDGTASLGANRHITFPAFDPYWAQYLWTSKPYEPDVEAIFRSLRHVPGKILVDCGANIGFWTVKLSDPAYGFTSFFAVEANPYVFDYLERNVASNGISAVACHAAIAERAGETVLIDCSQGHAVGAVGDCGTPVQTISIASLLTSRLKNADGQRQLAIVKLDVEGSEIAAVKGAHGVDDVDLLFVYEDWPRSGLTVSEFLLSEGYSIVGMHTDGEAEHLADLGSIHDFNRRSFPGYHPSNLVATMSPHLFPAQAGCSRKDETPAYPGERDR